VYWLIIGMSVGLDRVWVWFGGSACTDDEREIPGNEPGIIDVAVETKLEVVLGKNWIFAADKVCLRVARFSRRLCKRARSVR
jgi:hypothetical protein